MYYLKQYKSFVNSYYLAEGIRITIGIALPAIVLSYFNNLSTGIMVSIGAMCVSIPDNAGPINHRRNAMLICDALIFIAAVCTGFATSYPVILGPMLFTFCFLFAMIGVYGTRASSIGLAALFVMVLNIDRPQHGWNIIINAAYVLAGGIWYTLLSLSLYSFRPYKLAQQALGECIQSTADYLRLRASFYSKGNDTDRIYDDLLDAQSKVHEKQNLVRELLFRSRDIIKESTDTGRVMVMIFLDIVDLFERVITSHQNYKTLHHFFDETDIMEKFKETILFLSNELDEIGIAVKSEEVVRPNTELNNRIKNLKEYFEKLRDENRNAENVEGFISLRHILENIEDIGDRIYTLQNYTTYDKKLTKNFDPSIEHEQFVAHEDIEPKLLFSNFSLQSNTFRHALRLSIATITGYIISKFLPFSHSYWILLTIIVILKPAYSLTKKRNYNRLIGTIVGALFGFAILFFIKDKTTVFVIMVLLMIGAYSFMRTNYLVFVSLMTPYILLLFHLLNANNFKVVVTDRIIDTAIGSAIAFIANIFLLPVWEHEQVTDYMIKMTEDNLQYFLNVASVFTPLGDGGIISINQYKLSRKNAFVSLANLSDALNRMLSEPKNKQKNIREVHQFVVANHVLTSSIATLSLYTQQKQTQSNDDIFSPVSNIIENKLNDAKKKLQHQTKKENTNNKIALRTLNDKLNDLLQQRKKELENGITESETKKDLAAFKPIADQLNFINKAASDIEKLSDAFRRNE
jgi:uncharacterized membrane protein (TIGR01666 family)